MPFGSGVLSEATQTKTAHGRRLFFFVAKAEDWEWSSARWYAGMRPVPVEMESMVLEELSRAGPPWAEW
jgi:hypothetical protein